jgi:hypothetical protein
MERELLMKNKGKPIHVNFDDGSSFVINTKDEDLRASLLNTIISFVDGDNGVKRVVVESL